MKKYLIIILLSLSLFSCTDDIIIDVQEGPKLVGVSGYITNEYKKHQIVLSWTSDFYSKDETEMISGAEVFIHDDSDTIYFEETEQKGHYETLDPVAGVIGHTYHLNINIFDNEEMHHYYAKSTMKDNVAQIDSIIIKDVAMGGMQFNIKGLYAYFQSNTDPSVNYLIDAAINDSLLNESLLKCAAYSLAGASGFYINGPEFIELFGELPLHIFGNDKNGNSILNEGDSVTLYLYSITQEFSKYISDVNGNIGSNPMMGMPYNVSTNIYPEGKAVGFFEAASVTKSTVIY
ncbi:MAG: DUF4249 family protein [Bacteroidales bacterium]|nr:DUF4249 family protein [Bacteroidales bacterium]